MESKIAYLNAELLLCREKEREEREKKIAAKGGRKQEASGDESSGRVMRMISLIRRVRVGNKKLQQFAACFAAENRPPEVEFQK
ncbi:hypothetical protein H5410_026247 [Solanum commersonii]|uniref:Uncharacterized protein n=1 Tax=Solanum commersonii TaxID=4109 RepID=A0A9J5YVJ1_SOLCO|nr:hypothetical protein H5410_026247 [Solanum commersonii]